MRWPYILSLIALLGAALLLFFNVLCGATTHAPLNKWYWLEADTSSIPGANSVTRWTNYASCSVSGGKNTDCSSKKAAYPMSPVSNFGTSEGVPSGLSSKHGVTYYLSKVGWAFLLIGLLFTLLALLPVLVSFCIPTLSILNIGSGIATSAALLFTALSAALLTACYVKARNAFQNDGKSASLGKTMLGFVWASTFLLGLSSLFSGVGCLGNFFAGRKKKRQSDNYDSSSHETYGNDYTQEKTNQPRSGGFFGRKKNNQAQDLEDVGYAAGVGATGATSDYTKTGTAGTGTGTGTGTAGNRGIGYAAGAGVAGATAAGVLSGSSRDPNTGAMKSSKDPNTGETIDDVGKAAGLGATGATSDYTKNNTGSTAGQKGVSSTGETLDDVAYAAGLGSSGATSDYTKPGATTGSTGYGTTGYGSSNTKSGHSGLGMAAAAGATGAVVGGALGSGHKDKSTYGDSTGYGTDEYGHGKTTTGGAAYSSNTGEKLDDVAYASGLGASGATSSYTGTGKNDAYSSKDYADNGYNSKTTGTHVPASKPNDTDAALGHDITSTSSQPSGASKGLWASAAAALGIGGAAAAASGSRDKDGSNVDPGLRDNKYDTGATTGDYGYNAENTDVGAGATRAGLNAEQEDKRKGTYENKSTVLPVGGKHITSDGYGNKTAGYETGVPEGAARSAATASAVGGIAAGGATAAGSGKGTYRPVKDGAATRAEDTYNSSNINQEKTAKDLTTTHGYEPTSYYSRKTGDTTTGGYDSAGKTAGSGVAGGKLQSGTQNPTRDPTTGETLDDVAYAAGLGASGVTSDKSKTKTSISSGQKGWSSTGEKLDDVGYAAGLGASGATSNAKTTTPSGTSGYSSGPNSKSTKQDSSHLGLGTAGVSAAGTAAALGSAHNKSSGTAPSSTSKSSGYGNTSNPTKGPNGESLDDVAYAAGLGASGATSNVTKKRSDSNFDEKKRSSGIATWFGGKNKRDSTTSSVYDDDEIVGQSGRQANYSDNKSGRHAGGATTGAGLGAAAAGTTAAAVAETQDYTKRDKSGVTSSTTGASSSGKQASTSNQATSSTKGPNGEKLSDVEYAAGLGASGATSDITSSKNKSTQGLSSKYSSSTGNNQTSGKLAAGATTAGVLGADTAGAYGMEKHSQGKSSSGYGFTPDKHGSGSGYNKTDSSGTADTFYTSTSKGSHGQVDERTRAKAIVDPLRNRNPIAEGVASGSVSKPANADPSSSTYDSNTGDKLRGENNSSSSRSGKSAEVLGAGAGAAGLTSAAAASSTHGSHTTHGTSSTARGTSSLDPTSNRYETSGAHTSTASSSLDPASNRYGDHGYSATKSNSLDPISGKTGDDDLPGSFPGGSSNLSSPIQKTYKGTIGKDDSNYTTAGMTGSGAGIQPRAYKDEELRQLEQRQQEGEQPGLIQQIVDTAKSVM